MEPAEGTVGGKSREISKRVAAWRSGKRSRELKEGKTSAHHLFNRGGNTGEEGMDGWMDGWDGEAEGFY